jgi:DNA primase catalytic core
MARIPEEEIERLKREVPLLRMAEARGIELRKHGAEDLVGLCPMHPEKTASMVISPGKNLFHCFGCGSAGSPVDWVMKLEGVSFRQAVELLRAGYPSGLVSSSAARPVKKSTVPKLPAPFALEADDQKLLREVVDYYHESLKQSPEALEYLAGRGLKSPEMVERFHLGFSNRTLGYRLPGKNRAAGAEIRGRLQNLGILRESGHELMNGSVVVPIFGEDGEVLGLYGRKITAGLRKGTPLHLYLPGPHRGVWNVEALGASPEIILCEAIIDALTLWCAGFRNVTASYGVSGFTEEMMDSFRRYKTKRVLIAYDGDDAGERAAQALAEQLMAEGIECFRIQFPKGMDANEYALKVQPAPKSLGLLVRKALWLGKGRAPDREDRAESEPRPRQAAALPSESEERPAEASAANGRERHERTPIAERTEPTSSLVARAAAEPQPMLSAPEAPEPKTAEVLAAAAVAEPLAASPVPLAPAAGLDLEVRGEQIELRLGDRFFRVRGLAKNTSFEQLRVNVLCARADAFHVDTLDMYSARQRAAYIKQAAVELGVQDEVLKRDLGRLLLGLEELHERQMREALAPKQQAVSLSEQERQEALELLRDPKLLDRILGDFERCGIVGEQTNKLLGYLSAVSRKLEEPLAIIIQSSSAAGKTSLMEAVLAFMPEEERVKFSAMTGQSLFYMGERDLQHKILAIVEEEGAQRASYALKLLQSEGELSIASTGKDPATGRLVTQEYEVKGPVMILLTTTAIELDEELQNRCIVLAVDEEREQTRAIHRLQRERETLSGLWAREERKRLLKLHQDAQRLLRPLVVVNPYAPALTFLDEQTRTRRDHMKYLALIRSVALLYQYQRQLKSSSRFGEEKHYIEVEPADIELANRLMHEALGRSLDELPPQSRRLLGMLGQMVTQQCERLSMERADFRFSRRDVREFIGWSDFAVKVHMHKLEELEYVLVHRGGRGQSFVYELLYGGKGQDGRRFVMGLLDPGRLGQLYDENKEHQKQELEGPRSPQGAPKELSSSPRVDLEEADGQGSLASLREKSPKNAHLDGSKQSPSYAHAARNGSAAAAAEEVA